MLENALLLGFMYGWLALWPIARWGLRWTGTASVVLKWTFIAGLLLEARSLAYVWDLHRTSNRDWWMAWMVPQFVAVLAWLISLASLVALWVAHGSKAQRYP